MAKLRTGSLGATPKSIVSGMTISVRKAFMRLHQTSFIHTWFHFLNQLNIESMGIPIVPTEKDETSGEHGKTRNDVGDSRRITCRSKREYNRRESPIKKYKVL